MKINIVTLLIIDTGMNLSLCDSEFCAVMAEKESSALSSSKLLEKGWPTTRKLKKHHRK